MSIALSACAVNASHAAGAYAIGKSWRSSWGGGATNAANYADAGREALARCSKYGPGCEIAVYFNRKCFSLAVPPGTGAYYWATRDTIDEARATVMDHCVASGRSCEVKVAFCDMRGIAAPLPPEIRQVAPVPTAAAPRLEERPAPKEQLALPAVDGKLLLLLAIGLIVVIGVVVALRKLSFEFESGYSARSAERYDSEAARFQAMSRKLDAETELAESVIKAKRTQAELDDIQEMFRD
jgi:hypothetical protein